MTAGKRPQPRYRASVSLESDTEPVRTFRGEIVAANARLGVRRALQAAQRAYPKARWRSCVVVLRNLTSAATPNGRPRRRGQMRS